MPFLCPLKVDFPFDDDMLERIRQLDQNSFSLSDCEIVKNQNRNFAEMEKFVQDRKEFLPYANWHKFGRVSELVPDVSTFNKKHGDFDHTHPRNNIFQVRADILENFGSMSRRLIPNSLVGASEDVQKSLLPVHVGEVLAYMTNFIDEKLTILRILG